MLGLVENLGVHGAALSALKVYVGLLAATILFIATNAGVIGASRITYAMASYRQLPEVFRRLHKKFKTPYISLLVFAGLIPMIVLLPGKTAFLGTMYSFGAMLSFTVAHASIVALRYKHRDESCSSARGRTCASAASTGRCSRIFGGLGTALSWLVVVEQEAPTRWAGLGWLAAGFVMYAVYRRRVVHAPLTETVRAPVVIGPAVALEYRNVLVPVVWRRESEAARRPRLPPRQPSGAASIVALTVLEVPLELPLDAELPGEAERKAHELLDEARAIGDAYGVDVSRPARARAAGRPRDRRGGRAAQQRDRGDGRAAPRRAPPPRPDLRRHRRLRAQERALPRDGGGCAAARHERHCTAG